MKNFIVMILLILGGSAQAQESPISVMDFVKFRDGKKAETMFFYENNWKIYREAALKKGFIKSYQILAPKSGTVDFDLILITVYADSLQRSRGEERFQKIIKELRPNGPKLMNEHRPADFRIQMFNTTAEHLIQAQ